MSFLTIRDPRNDRGSVFVVMPPARLAFLATATRPASQRLLPALLCLSLLASGMVEVIGFDSALQLAIGLLGHGGMA